MDQAPDIVVPVRKSPANQELRYALRSWQAHLPHRRVWIVGHRPPWATAVQHIATRQDGTKYQNTTLAVRRACEHPEISDPFLLANDDMFSMSPIGDMPVLHRGPVAQVEAYYAARASGKYLRGMRETAALLASLGHAEPLSYELHVPLPVRKADMLTALDAGRHIPVLHKRTLYGNLAGLGGERIDDVKILHRGPRFPKDSPWLSTMPDSFANGMVGDHIRRAFPQASGYETGGR